MVKWINAFPTKGGKSKTMSPSMIIKGNPNPDFNQERILLGSHALVYTVTSNTMNRRSIPSISQNEPNNHGGNYLMRL